MVNSCSSLNTCVTPNIISRRISVQVHSKMDVENSYYVSFSMTYHELWWFLRKRFGLFLKFSNEIDESAFGVTRAHLDFVNYCLIGIFFKKQYRRAFCLKALSNTVKNFSTHFFNFFLSWGLNTLMWRNMQVLNVFCIGINLLPTLGLLNIFFVFSNIGLSFFKRRVANLS